MISLGVLGAALLYGDGAITPAISVLSALEGLKTPVPAIAPYIVALSALILVGLFALQPQGSERIGKLFGPIMTLWFLTIGVLGLVGIMNHPGVLVALNPRYGFAYLFGHGLTGFLVLGAVFLCATGAEALYADMGHFGAKPIRVAWYGLVLPCLLLNYAGQTAIVVEGSAGANPFFSLCPDAWQVPLVVLATVATIIASQAIISGAFSMTRQAIQLGLCPRLHIVQTSAAGYGQIYIGFVNWSLMILTLALTLGFRSSDNLAAAFGIAVATTMLLTSVLMFLAMREVWGWSLPISLACCRLVRRGRPVVCQREHDEGVRRRLVSARGRRDRVLSDVHLVAGPPRAAARARARHLFAIRFHPPGSHQDPRARDRGLYDQPARHGAGAASAQSQAQQSAA